MRAPTHGRSAVLKAALVLATIVALLVTSPSGGVAVPGEVVGVQGAAARARPVIVIHSVGARQVGESVPISGRTARHTRGRHKLVLQQYSASGRWVTRSSQLVRNGPYRFASRRVSSPGVVRFRTVLYGRGRPVAYSRHLVVRVVATSKTCASAPSATTCPRPAATTEERTTATPYCPQLTVTVQAWKRSVTWRWSTSTTRWVKVYSAWVAGAQSLRPAGAADCVKVVDEVPPAAALPDLRIKDLTKCGRGDSEATNGTCFMIVPSAPYNADFPALEGRKLLKFGVITLNVGAGPGEVIADRSAEQAEDWKAYQSFYDADGTLLGSRPAPGVEFYFAGDGHNHWHVRDFDSYELLDAAGTTQAAAEKHGYCMQDNTSYGPLNGMPGVPAAPVYADATSCGKALPQALTIVHGLSRGWGDTYPTTLPDQAIDITDVPDGVYTVRIAADSAQAVIESDETNNVTEVKIQITGDVVTVLPGTSSGGLP